MTTIASQITSLTVFLLNRLFRRRSKKTSKLRVTGLCVGNSPGPVNSPHKGSVTRKMFPFDDVIMGMVADARCEMDAKPSKAKIDPTVCYIDYDMYIAGLRCKWVINIQSPTNLWIRIMTCDDFIYQYLISPGINDNYWYISCIPLKLNGMVTKAHWFMMILLQYSAPPYIAVNFHLINHAMHP